jgi:hypothetical protein
MHDILTPIKENGLNPDLVTYSIRNMCGRDSQYTKSEEMLREIQVARMKYKLLGSSNLICQKGSFH